MAKSILHTIERNMPTFSKGQKRIADYILQNYDKAAFMTASKLGKLSGVSESTVVRFASELGYDGYPSMQRALQEMIRSRLTSTQRIQAADNLFGGQDVLSAVIQSDMDKLRMVAEEADRTEFNKVVDLILGAGLFTAVYILARAAGKYGGAYLGARFTHSPQTVQKYLGLTLLPHSGVSLVFTGIAVSVLRGPAPECAAVLQGTIAAAAVINEIIAVVTAKKGFEWAGELNQGGPEAPA